MAKPGSTSFDEQIAANRAKKKSKIIKIFALPLLFVLVVAALYGAISAMLPSAENPLAPEIASLDPLNGTELNAVRKSLQKTLNGVDNKLQQVANNQGILNWQPDKLGSMQRALALTYDYYGASKYQQAAAELVKLEQDIDGLRREYDGAFASLHAQAQVQFDDVQIENAHRLNTQALAINGNYLPAVQLQKRIEVYPQIQRLYEQVRVAEVEKNLPKQHLALQKIVALDPQRQDIKQKLAGVAAKLQGQEYSKQFSKALNAYDQQQYAQAQTALTLAASFNSAGLEIETLQVKIDDALNALGVAKIERQIGIFSTADEWSTVKILSEKALKNHPDNKLLQDALQSAKQIMMHSNKLDVYLAQPNRLSDANIGSRAQNDILQAKSLTVLSAKLQQKVQQVAELVQQQNQSIEVSLKSDNRTFVEVLGVGVVGQFRAKTISLKPGVYQLKGTRQGYQTEIMPLRVEKTASAIVVTIECSERI
jgi:hypothetical protein